MFLLWAFCFPPARKQNAPMVSHQVRVRAIIHLACPPLARWVGQGVLSVVSTFHARHKGLKCSNLLQSHYTIVWEFCYAQFSGLRPRFFPHVCAFFTYSRSDSRLTIQ